MSTEYGRNKEFQERSIHSGTSFGMSGRHITQGNNSNARFGEHSIIMSHSISTSQGANPDSSQGNSEIYMSWGQSQPETKEERKRRKNESDMSCAIIFPTNDGIFVAADKRCRTSNSSNSVDDTYQKIAVIQGANLAVVSTGVHPIGEVTIEKIISEVKSTSISEMLRELDSRIRDLKFPEGWRTFFTVCESLRAGYGVVRNNYYQMICTGKEPIIEKKYDVEPFVIHSHGESWVNGLLGGIRYQDIPHNNPREYIEKLLRNIIRFSDECTVSKTVGGGISMLFLTPEGNEWLER